MDHSAHMHHVMEVVTYTFLSMLVFSLSVSAHCAGMCGPLLATQLYNRPHYWRRLIAYHAGRLLSYTAAGAIAGGLAQLSWQPDSTWSLLSQALTLCFGVILFLMAIYKLNRRYAATRFVSLFKTIQLRVQHSSERLLKLLFSVLQKAPSSLQPLLLGLFTVLLPCMTLSSALAASFATAHVGSGAALMLAFFIGTVPVMSLAPSLVRLLPSWVPAEALSACLLIVAAFITILRGCGIHLH